MRREAIKPIADIYGCTLYRKKGGMMFVWAFGQEEKPIGNWDDLQHWTAKQWQETFERLSGKQIASAWTRQSEVVE